MKIKRTNLYKEMKTEINEKTFNIIINSLFTAGFITAAAVVDSSLIKESIKDPKFLVALPFCLLGTVVGASFAVSLTKETIDHLKELRELLQLKKDYIEELENNNINEEYSLKFKRIVNK